MAPAPARSLGRKRSPARARRKNLALAVLLVIYLLVQIVLARRAATSSSAAAWSGATLAQDAPPRGDGVGVVVGEGGRNATRPGRRGTAAGEGQRHRGGVGSGVDGVANATAAEEERGGGVDDVPKEELNWNPTALFTPEEFAKGNVYGYFNLPMLPENVNASYVERSAWQAMREEPGEPLGLPHEARHEARPLGSAGGSDDAIVGFAAWPNMLEHFVRFVGSLRRGGFDGRILLGVHPSISTEERAYLQSQNVTSHSVEFAECDPTTKATGDDNPQRKLDALWGKCARGVEDLRLQWGRHELFRRWLRACEGCTGWVMTSDDVRDVFSQSHPFAGLPSPGGARYDLMFAEEVAKHSCPDGKCENQQRYRTLGRSNLAGDGNKACYGEYHKPFMDRPVLSSGVVVGTRNGMDRFLAVLVREFRDNLKKGNWRCKCPHVSDEVVIQYLYYTGKFGGLHRTRTMPWGYGPVHTLRFACVDDTVADPSGRHGAKDLVAFDERSGLIANGHEGEGSAHRVAPVVHGWGACRSWMRPFLEKHEDLFGKVETPSYNTTAGGERIYKVHLWDDSSPNDWGFREKLYTREGFGTHPRTTLADTPDDADIIAWVSVRGNMEAEIPPRNLFNVVVLDYADGCRPLHQKGGELMHVVGYFKRSFVCRDQEGVFLENATAESYVYPMAYSGIDALVSEDIHWGNRSVAITNVLREDNVHNTVRSKIVGWTREFVKRRGLENRTNVGTVGGGTSSSDWDGTYQGHLRDSRIIVTCNPLRWEGDFRLWEALLSGAMVMVDRMAIPYFMPYPFVPGEHLVYYDPRNRTEFDELLEHYVTHGDEARRIGEAGYRYVLDHHMPRDRVSYVLDKIESKLELD